VNPIVIRTARVFLWSIVLAVVCLLALDVDQRVAQSGCMLPPSHEMEFEGEHRFYDVRLPPDYSGTHPLPAVVVLHGGGGSASRTERITGWTELAAEAGFLVIYPEGVDSYWNDGRKTRYSRAARNDVNDVGYLDAVIDIVAQHYPIDPKRIYFTGVSNGGIMALRYATERPERVAAVSAISAQLPDSLAHVSHPGFAVPAMFVFGTDDGLVPYEGGAIEILSTERGAVLGAEESARVWAEWNGCATPPTENLLPDLVPNDGTETDIITYGACREEAEVVLYRVRGGGHGLPGGHVEWPASLFERTSHDLDSVAESLKFFQKHGRK
jgi:polyhydroxybutyrate depolymerase